jgi:lysyl-tRNA synthetase class I
MQPYFFQNGSRKLAQEISGRENIYLGIRPYGFHAGNMLPLVLYPMLLGQELKKLGEEPQFNIFIFINDWEQDGLAGPDIKEYPFNIFPENTTFQYTLDPENKGTNIVDFWEPIIVENIRQIQSFFPMVKIKSVRNSELKNNSIMKKHLLFTIQNPHVVADVLRKYSNKQVLDNPLCYAMAVCPQCFKVKGESFVNNEEVTHLCKNCGVKAVGSYSDFDYWFYHKPLALPRLEIFNIDICITGSDHYNEGDFIVRQELIKKYGSKAKPPRTLYSQVVLGRDGDTMGKSRGNAETIEVNDLLRLFNKYPNEKTIKIS